MVVPIYLTLFNGYDCSDLAELKILHHDQSKIGDFAATFNYRPFFPIHRRYEREEHCSKTFDEIEYALITIYHWKLQRSASSQIPPMENDTG